VASSYTDIITTDALDRLNGVSAVSGKDKQVLWSGTTQSRSVRFQVLTAASMKMAVFWVVASSSLVDVHRRFRGACCFHHQGDDRGIALTMEAASASETLVYFYQTTRRKNPEDSHLQSRSVY
jgi:hypothetical protein